MARSFPTSPAALQLDLDRAKGHRRPARHYREHGRLWRGHSRPAQPHGNSISIVHRVHRRPARANCVVVDPAQAGYPVIPSSDRMAHEVRQQYCGWRRARPRGEKGGRWSSMPRPIPDPTIMTNFLTMAETTVCKATLSSCSGSEALLVSTSPEHRELACPTRVPGRVAQKIRGQSFPSLTERSLAGFLLARAENG